MFPRSRAQAIRLVALDVDGVLTDGILHLDGEGRESKRFHVRDGLGIRLLLDAGIKVGLITARSSEAVARRGKELSLSFVRQGVRGNKWLCLKEEMTTLGLEAHQCAFMGDDLIDLGILQRVGLSAAPADAEPEVLDNVHWVSGKNGGRGAVRELAKNILMAQGLWEGILLHMGLEKGSWAVPLEHDTQP